jgi:hypothetical protein
MGDLVGTISIIGGSVHVYIVIPRNRTQTIPAPNPNHTTPGEIFGQSQPHHLQLIQRFLLTPDPFPTARSNDLNEDRQIIFPGPLRGSRVNFLHFPKQYPDVLRREKHTPSYHRRGLTLHTFGADFESYSQ